MRPLVFIAALGIVSCTAEVKVPTVPEKIVVPEITTVAVTPRETTRPNRTVHGNWSAPSAVWSQNGAATVLDGTNVQQRNSDDFVAILVGTDSAPNTMGQLKAMTRRNGGVFIASTTGFFHDAPGRLLRAPVSDDFSMAQVRFVDASSNALFVTTDAEAYRVFNNRRDAVRVNDADETGALQVVAGRSDTEALLIRGASLYLINLEAKSVKVLARGLGTVTAIDHLADGSVLFGTSSGLITVANDDSVSLHTFGSEIIDVEVTEDATLVMTNSKLLQLTTTGAVVLADVSEAWPDAMTKDAAKDLWFIDGANVVRLSTSTTAPPPSFAADVKPFMTAHCASCHKSGAGYAPIFDLENFGTAKRYASLVLNRLQDTAAPMPPTSTEVLTASQYEIVVRWVEGGMLP